MKKLLTKYLEMALVFICVCFGISFLLSLSRAMGHDQCFYNEKGIKICPNTPCAQLYIDKLEPLLSTRLFCEIGK